VEAEDDPVEMLLDLFRILGGDTFVAGERRKKTRDALAVGLVPRLAPLAGSRRVMAGGMAGSGAVRALTQIYGSPEKEAPGRL
jgi:hypothetical protein